MKVEGAVSSKVQEAYEDGLEDGAEIQKGKLVPTSITENGTYSREDGYASVTVNTEALTGQTKDYSITSNGTTSISPDAGYNAITAGTITVSVGQEDAKFKEYIQGYSRQVNEEDLSGCTQLKSRAFAYSVNLEEAYIPSSVTRYTGGYIYNGDSSLTDVQLSTADLSGSCHFQACPILQRIEIPEGVETIGSYCFANDMMLNEIKLPSTLKKIGNYAFSATSITSIVIPEGVTSIGDYAFDQCSILKSVYLPSTLTSIGAYAFRNCDSLEAIYVPDSVTSIGNLAFAYCDGLKHFKFPTGTTIVTNCLQGCTHLKTVIFHSGITAVNTNALSGCTALEGIYFMGETPPTFANSAMSSSSSCKIYVPTGKVSAYSSAIKPATTAVRNRLAEAQTFLRYETSDGQPIDDTQLPLTGWGSGVTIASNQYTVAENGLITFNGVVTSIPDTAFVPFNTLTSLYAPFSVTSFGHIALGNNKALQGYTTTSGNTYYGYLPPHLESIGSLGIQSDNVDWIVPQSLKTIGSGGFANFKSATFTGRPPVITNIIGSGKVIVPPEMYDAYRTAWSAEYVPTIYQPEPYQSYSTSYYNDNTIEYTSTDDKIVRLNTYKRWNGNYGSAFIANENTYENGEGKIKFQYTVNLLPVRGFSNKSRLKTLKLPKNIGDIETKGLANLPNLEALYIDFDGYVNASPDAFDDTNPDAVIYVHSNLEEYQAGWTYFHNFQLW